MAQFMGRSVTTAVAQATSLVCAESFISPDYRTQKDKPTPTQTDTRDLPVEATANAKTSSLEPKTGKPIITTEVTPGTAHRYTDLLAIVYDPIQFHTNKTASHKTLTTSTSTM